jgi:hypothetical protein
VATSARIALASWITVRGGPRVRAASLIAHADEQRGDVLAVLLGFGKHRARTRALDAFWCQEHLDPMGFGVVAFHLAFRARFANVNVLDHPTAGVLEATQEGARA